MIATNVTKTVKEKSTKYYTILFKIYGRINDGLDEFSIRN